MNFLVCGLGSMGKRRIRLLKSIDDSYQIFGFDLNEERCKSVSFEYGIDCFSSLDNIDVSLYDAVIVSTSPLAHFEIIKYALCNKKHVFTEINLIKDWYDDALELANKNGVKLFMSSTLNYRNDIKKIYDIVSKSNNKSTYIYHVGQYLPDWHPWESYKNFFVADKKTNGCREIFAIDLPWIYKVFGDFKNINFIYGKHSNLEVDYNDTYLVLVEHENGNKGTIVVDIVSRKAIRHLEVINEDFYIDWLGKPDSLYIFDPIERKEKLITTYENVDRNSNYSGNIIENAYRDELIAFIQYIDNDVQPLYSFEDDKKIISLIDGIEE